MKTFRIGTVIFEQIFSTVYTYILRLRKKLPSIYSMCSFFWKNMFFFGKKKYFYVMILSIIFELNEWMFTISE